MSSEIDSWREEKQSAYLYRVLAQVEKGTRREKLFLGLADTADGQSQIWALALKKKGLPQPEEFVPDLRARIVASLIRILGPRAIKQVLAASKVRGISVYSMAEVKVHEMPTQATLGEIIHKSTGGGANLRAAVFGLNDGLVSNASLIMGVAGAVNGATNHSGGSGSAVLVSGVAGLLAGAFSMASGEYVSMSSQRELYEYQIDLEREELAQYPQEEARELALIYEAKGVASVDAQRIAEQLTADPEKALDTLAREELGLNPDELGSPFGAALFSFVAFALGASIPLIPFLIHSGAHPLEWSIGLTGVSLFVMGAVLSLFTGKSVLKGGFRMLFVGGIAGVATYWIGRALGVTLS